MANCQAGHRGVDGVVVERHCLGAGVDREGRVGRALGAPRRARLDREDPGIACLVGSGAGTDVYDRARVAEGGVNPRGDAGVGAPVTGIGAAVLFVVDSRP
jgi:hypothetical protein